MGGDQVVGLGGVVQAALPKCGVGVGGHALQLLCTVACTGLLQQLPQALGELAVVRGDLLVAGSALQAVSQHAVGVKHDAETNHVVDGVQCAGDLHQGSVVHLGGVEGGAVSVISVHRSVSVDGLVGQELQVHELHGSTGPQHLQGGEQIPQVLLLFEVQALPLLVEVWRGLLHEGGLDLLLRADAGWQPQQIVVPRHGHRVNI